MNELLEILDSCPSTDRRKMKPWLVEKYSNAIESKHASEVVKEYLTIKRACYELAGEIFGKDKNTELFEKRIFSRYPYLSEKLKKQWINETMMAQFR